MLLAGCLAGPWGAHSALAAAASPPPAAETAPASQSRSPQAYYVPEQEDVEEWSQAVGNPAPSSGWGWLGRLFKGKPRPEVAPPDQTAPEDDQAP